ncbi:MAG: carbon starvation CstA 5TM domain-containing protein, partial [Planctomycetota bacterium]|nr:carbon starvation CstA 5TM domain-containing protein [Planctomycetota bacterium]
MDQGLAPKVGAFVDGSANFIASLGIPAGIAVALMGVFVASFAGTTLDTACRLQRYVVQELASTSGSVFRPLRFLQNPHAAAGLSVVLAAALAAIP